MDILNSTFQNWEEKFRACVKKIVIWFLGQIAHPYLKGLIEMNDTHLLYIWLCLCPCCQMEDTLLNNAVKSCEGYTAEYCCEELWSQLAKCHGITPLMVLTAMKLAAQRTHKYN